MILYIHNKAMNLPINGDLDEILAVSYYTKVSASSIPERFMTAKTSLNDSNTGMMEKLENLSFNQGESLETKCCIS